MLLRNSVTMLSSVFFEHIQKKCLPGIWSRGVSLARAYAIFVDLPITVPKTALPEDLVAEWVLRVRAPDRPVSLKINLWPEDEDWHCDCQDRNDVCAHVAAAVIALKNGTAQFSESSQSLTRHKSAVTQLIYRFRKSLQQELLLDRWLVANHSSENSGARPPDRLTTSLVALMGGIQSGRIHIPPLAATQEDYGIDALVSNTPEPLDVLSLQKLFKYLVGHPSLELDGSPVTISTTPRQMSVELRAENNGFRLQQIEDNAISEVFRNGAVRCDNVLQTISIPDLDPALRTLLQGNGRFFSRTELPRLLTEVLPALENKNQRKNCGPRITESSPGATPHRP